MLLIASGVVALTGLSRMLYGDMPLRNIGIAGDVGIFPGAVLLLAILFYKATPCEAPDRQRG